MCWRILNDILQFQLWMISCHIVNLKDLFVFSRIAPAMLRQASYGTIKIGTYQSFKRLLVDRPEGEFPQLWMNCWESHRDVDCAGLLLTGCKKDIRWDLLKPTC